MIFSLEIEPVAHKQFSFSLFQITRGPGQFTHDFKIDPHISTLMGPLHVYNLNFSYPWQLKRPAEPKGFRTIWPQNRTHSDTAISFKTALQVHVPVTIKAILFLKDGAICVKRMMLFVWKLPGSNYMIKGQVNQVLVITCNLFCGVILSH